MKILFILKYRDNKYACDKPYNSPYDGSYGYSLLSSGLMNSANFVCDNLVNNNVDASVVHAVDNNSIDKLVTEAKPDIVIIEAFWVVPEKFEVLTRLHPRVKWIIRNHSAIPFAATEGQILDWSLRYMDYKNVSVSCNDDRTNDELRTLISIYKPEFSEHELHKRVPHLPNFYPTGGHKKPKPHDDGKDTLDISCFGAIRPLKNHLIQAIAAIKLANETGKILNFHINGTRVEGNGNPVLRNLRCLFDKLPHKLVEHDWLSHDKFMDVLADMDLNLQVSYTETFNIVTADAVYQGIPVVTSSDIRWVHEVFNADPNDSNHILTVMKRTLAMSRLPEWHPSYINNESNIRKLKEYNDHSTEAWITKLMDMM